MRVGGGVELGALCRVCIDRRPCLGVAAPEARNSCLLGVRPRSSPPAPPPSLLLLGKCDLSQATFNYSDAVFWAHGVIKGLFSLLGMFEVFQAPKEREKGSGAKCFLDRPRGWVAAPSSHSASCGHPHPHAETRSPKVEGLEGRGWSPGSREGAPRAGDDGGRCVRA